MVSGRVASLAKSYFTLMVSIPKNDAEMAVAAQEGGADAIKTHLNVGHFASGTNYGSWSQEKHNIEHILSHVQIPVGLLPGADVVAEKSEILEAKEMGIDFLDAFAHHMPAYLWEIDGVGKMLAVNQDYDNIMIKGLDLLGVNMVEATLLPHSEYGKPLNMGDLALYYKLASSTIRPVIVPTQKKIRPEEISLLKDCGIRGIVIGAIVTGNTSEGVFKTTQAFRRAIDAME